MIICNVMRKQILIHTIAQASSLRVETIIITDNLPATLTATFHALVDFLDLKRFVSLVTLLFGGAGG